MTQIQNTNLWKGNALEKAAQKRLSKTIPFSADDLAMNDDGFFRKRRSCESITFIFASISKFSMTSPPVDTVYIIFACCNTKIYRSSPSVKGNCEKLAANEHEKPRISFNFVNFCVHSRLN